MAQPLSPTLSTTKPPDKTTRIQLFSSSMGTHVHPRFANNEVITGLEGPHAPMSSLSHFRDLDTASFLSPLSSLPSYLSPLIFPLCSSSFFVRSFSNNRFTSFDAIASFSATFISTSTEVSSTALKVPLGRKSATRPTSPLRFRSIEPMPSGYWRSRSLAKFNITSPPIIFMSPPS